MTEEIVDEWPEADRPYTSWSTLVTYGPDHGSEEAGRTFRMRADRDRRLALTREAWHTENGAVDVEMQRQNWVPGPWVNDDGPTVSPTRWTISRLPEDHEAYDSYVIHVTWRGNDRWAVYRGGGNRALFTTGEWIPDRVPSDVDADEWWALCRYPLDQAFRLAVIAADTIRVNGMTAGEVLAGRMFIGLCGNVRELPDGEAAPPCPERLYSYPRDAAVLCPNCGAYTGVASPGRPRRDA